MRTEKVARRYSKVKNYPEVAMAAIKEMHRQVGNLILDERGIALRGASRKAPGASQWARRNRKGGGVFGFSV
jgi:hypothetical protein